jgi:hypothetical protein
MKRGLEELSTETPSLKKIKTLSNGEGSGEVEWTKVEKKNKKKKKASKAESKVDVCIPFRSL